MPPNLGSSNEKQLLEAEQRVELTPEQLALDNFIRLIQSSPQVRIAVEKALKLSTIDFKTPTQVAKSNGVYYKRPYGEEMKRFVDDMIATHKPKIFYLRNAKYTINSLMCRLDQSLRFLINELDPTFTYYKFRKDVTLMRVYDPADRTKCIGAALRWNDQLLQEHGQLDGDNFDVEAYKTERKKASDINWRHQLNDWLEVPWSETLEKKDCKLDLVNLNLTDIEVAETELLIADLSEVTGKIEQNRIFLIKTKGQ